MAKKYLVTIGYNQLVAPSREAAFSILECFRVDRQYIDGENIYAPDSKLDMKVELIDDSKIRPITEEEKENKDLKEAQSNAEYYKNESKDLKKRIEELNCQIKVLTKEATDDSSPRT